MRASRTGMRGGRCTSNWWRLKFSRMTTDAWRGECDDAACRDAGRRATRAHQASRLRSDRERWQVLQIALEAGRRQRREAAWYAVSALLPVAFELVEELRRSAPAGFEFRD
ncbi:hypothetical protein PUN4_550053 [Paraburkholderia unamae]|nr:hypothetical protein PUN4_550053 [Paraburkholderia unamae]